MATYSGILVWNTPWTEKPGRVHGVSKSWTPTERLSRHSCCQKKIQRALLDMNSLWSENQTANKEASEWKVLRSQALRIYPSVYKTCK